MERLLSEHSVLIVDDNEISGQIVKHLITVKLPHFNLHAVDHIVDGLEYCSRHKTDVIIIDISNNENLSYDFMQLIRATNKKIRFILVTGASGASSPHRVSRFGNCSLLRMPTNLSELLESIQKAAIICET